MTLQPGEALVFTESLMHSTALYSGRGQRRTLFCTRQQALALFGSVGPCRVFSQQPWALTPAWLAGWCADKYVPYGTEPRGKTYSIKYDLSRPELTDDQRRILAWPEQWEEYGLGEYGPGVPEEQSAKL